jgi:murein DD-endopeptidase / murein LD-carboxypeptidase
MVDYCYRYILLSCLLLCIGCETLRRTASDKEIDRDKPASEIDLTQLAFDRKMSRQLDVFQNGGIEKSLQTRGKQPDQLIKEAERFLRTRHCMGGTSKKCIDCSGLIFIAFQNIGIAFPRVAEEQARYGWIIQNKEDLKRGDLVFFVHTYKTERLITHSGIYIGNQQFIHTSTSRGVMFSDINDPYYWHDKFIFGTRVF